MKLSAQFLRFGMVGGMGFAIDVGLLYLLMWFGMGPYLGRAVSVLTAATFTWQGNRRFTFAAPTRATAGMRSEWARYVSAMVFGGLVNYSIYALLITMYETFRAWPVLAVIASTSVSMLINFVAARWILHQPE